jgi:hypothetical protein
MLLLEHSRLSLCGNPAVMDENHPVSRPLPLFNFIYTTLSIGANFFPLLKMEKD